jgi:hypothetical protein
MEPLSAPTDLASDNRPRTGRGNLPQRFVFLLISTMGILLIFAGAYARYAVQERWVPDLCLGLGVAVAAPGMLSFLYRRYLIEDIKAELERPAAAFKERAIEMLDDALRLAFEGHRSREHSLDREMQDLVGEYRHDIKLLSSARHAALRGFYQSRRDAVGAFLYHLRNEHDHIALVGSSLLGLLQEADSEYEEARAVLQEQLRGGAKLHFLLTHPIIADLRARQENRHFTGIGHEIITSLRILIDEWKIDRSWIRLYKGTPTCFGIRTGEAMLLNAYPYMKEAYASPCLIALKGGYFYDHYDNTHFRAWSSAMAQPVPADLDDLDRQLPTFAKRIAELLELGETDESRYDYEHLAASR